MLRIAQAASSEYFTRYGTPPNQRRTPGKLDGELNIVDFYGGCWQYVFRAKDKAKADKIAWMMEGAVMNGNYIGYGQDSLASDGGKYPRTTAFDALFKMSNPDPRKLKTLVNCDCTSSMGFSVYFAGVYEPKLRTVWSGTAREILMGTGEFIELTGPLMLELGTGLRRGDILLWHNAKTNEGHAAICIDDDDHRDTFPVMITNCAHSRIRSGPGVEYETLQIVTKGDILEAEGTTTDMDGFPWYRVQVDTLDMMGYTSSAYATPLPQGRCTGDTWLRAEAGKKGKEVIVIPKGAKPYLTGRQTKVGIRVWYECVYGGHRGWASSLYLKK